MLTNMCTLVAQRRIESKSLRNHLQKAIRANVNSNSFIIHMNATLYDQSTEYQITNKHHSLCSQLCIDLSLNSLNNCSIADKCSFWILSHSYLSRWPMANDPGQVNIFQLSEKRIGPARQNWHAAWLHAIYPKPLQCSFEAQLNSSTIWRHDEKRRRAKCAQLILNALCKSS